MEVPPKSYIFVWDLGIPHLWKPAFVKNDKRNCLCLDLWPRVDLPVGPRKIQDGAPKIAKVPYKWLNSMV